MWVIFAHMPIYTPILVAVGVWAITQLAITVGSAIAGRSLGLTGDTTPPRREYSAPQALAAQGRYEEAALAWEIAAAESAGDPEPYLALARLFRDHLGRPEDAAGWFRRARRDAALPPGYDLLVSQELIELYRSKLGQPERAIPELARICERFPGTPNAAAAERELATLRETLVRPPDNQD
jgi:tetratricopeptide (TPR) repeat protein